MFSLVFNPTNIGKSLIVDSVNGVDATARPYSAQSPYQTLTAAKTAAIAGDTIVVRPGTYNEANLLKTGVNWHFEAGASVIYTGTADISIFDDAAGSVVCSITGFGVFKWQGTSPNSFTSETGDAPHNVIRIRNASSIVVVEADTLHAQWWQNTPDYTCAIYHSAGKLFVRAREITATTVSTHPDTKAGAIWWYSGDLYVTAERIAGKYTTLYFSWYGDPVPVGNAYVNADLIEQLGTHSNNSYRGAISQDGSEDDYAPVSWINVKECRVRVFISHGKMYFTAQKLIDASNSSAALSVASGQVWCDIQKLSCSGVQALSLTPSSLITPLPLFVHIHHVEVLAAPVGAVITMSSNDCPINVFVDKLVMPSTATVCQGVSLGNNGQFTGTVDATLATNCTPVLVASSGGVLSDCSLLAASGLNAISASTPQTVALRGGVNLSGAINSNVTPIRDTTPGRAVSTPAQITSNQNNYNPGLADHYRLSTDASRNITGLVAGMNGEPRFITNVGAQNIVLVNESASSTAANRFLVSTGADLTLAPNAMASLWYDSTVARWRVFG